MTIQLRRLRVSGRLARVLTALALLLGTLGASVAIGATAASADAAVHTIGRNTPVGWAPHVNDQYNTIGPANTPLTISCYMIGDTVTGQYGSEDVWDLISGGFFVPDADVWTGSNSPVVPACSPSWVTGTILGNTSQKIYNGPSTGDLYIDWVQPGQHVVVKCYTANPNSWVDGPYGWEDIWDELTAADGPTDWVPDALLYTGSNSAVVPHC